MSEMKESHVIKYWFIFDYPPLTLPINTYLLWVVRKSSTVKKLNELF